jgi:hypothetical protein
VSRIAHTLNRAPGSRRREKNAVASIAVKDFEEGSAEEASNREFGRPTEASGEISVSRTGDVRTRASETFDAHHQEHEPRAERTEEQPDTDLSDDMLKLVRYKVLFVKRGYEVAFPEKEEFVSDNVSDTTFIGWKLAEFTQHLDEIEVPRTWREKEYPKPVGGNGPDGMIHSLPEEDKKYLRVFYEVMARYTRNKLNHRKRELDVLEGIRNAIRDLGA